MYLCIYVSYYQLLCFYFLLSTLWMGLWVYLSDSQLPYNIDPKIGIVAVLEVLISVIADPWHACKNVYIWVCVSPLTSSLRQRQTQAAAAAEKDFLLPEPCPVLTPFSLSASHAQPYSESERGREKMESQEISSKIRGRCAQGLHITRTLGLISIWIHNNSAKLCITIYLVHSPR